MGVDHGGEGAGYEIGDCQLHTEKDFEGCDGKEKNVDLYVHTACRHDDGKGSGTEIATPMGCTLYTRL